MGPSWSAPAAELLHSVHVHCTGTEDAGLPLIFNTNQVQAEPPSPTPQVLEIFSIVRCSIYQIPSPVTATGRLPRLTVSTGVSIPAPPEASPMSTGTALVCVHYSERNRHGVHFLVPAQYCRQYLTNTSIQLSGWEMQSDHTNLRFSGRKSSLFL